MTLKQETQDPKRELTDDEFQDLAWKTLVI